MKNKILMACALMTFASSLFAVSDLCSVNMYGYGKGGASYWDQQSWRETVTLESGQSAGLYPTTNWVNLGSGDTSAVLLTEQGFTLTYTLNNLRNASPYWWTQTRTTLIGDGDGDLLDGHFNGTEDDASGVPSLPARVVDFTLSNIPAYPSYNVIIYLRGSQGQWYNGTGKIAVNGGAQQDFYLGPNAEFSGTYTEIVGLNAGNYIVFSGLTGSTFNAQIWGNGFNHLGPAGFQIYVPDTGGLLPEDACLTALTELKDHIEGTITLTDVEIAAHKATIDADKLVFGTSVNVMTAAINMVQAYDTVHGPLWMNGSTISSTWDKRTVPEDIHRATFFVMQYLIDYSYTAANLAANEALLGSCKFGTADYFPGYVAPPADPSVTYTATINGSFPDTFGHNTMMWADTPARKPTGTYLAPGTVATVTVPSALVNAGYKVRVGAHSWDLVGKPFATRLDRVSLVYDITSTETKVTNPLGGGIYIEVPFLANAGVVNVQIKNAVLSPFYSNNTVTGHVTTLTDWQNVERNHLAPWADFQTEKFMCQVPTSWIYAYADPVTAMADWDKAMDTTNDLMGFPHNRGKKSLYLQVDTIIRAGAYSPGYPQNNTTYNPKTDYGGNSSNFFLTGPQNAPSHCLHEMGHAYLFKKFSGETESHVNLHHVPVWNVKFGYDLDYAFAASRGEQNNPYKTLDNTATTWMLCFNFINNVPMEQLEKQYQLKGHAKFVDIARLFGWKANYNYHYQMLLDGVGSTSSTLTDDDLIVRLAIACGVDIRPLLQFWGIHATDPTAVANAIAAANLPKSAEIYDLIAYYRTLVPADNAAFQTFTYNWWGKQSSVDGYQTESEHAQQWYTYNSGSHDAIVAVIDNLLAAYFPYGRPVEAKDMFSVNFCNTGKPSPSVWDDPAAKETLQLAPGQAAGAGAYKTTGWENIQFPSAWTTSLGPVTINSAAGSTATLQVTDRRNGSPYYWNAVRDDSDAVDVGNATLLDAHCNGTDDPYDGSAIFDMTVSNIAFAKYDVIIYMGINQAQSYNGNGVIVFNGVQQNFKTFTTESDGALVQIADSVTPGNYIVFKDVTGSSFSVQVWGEAFTHLGPAGFQIVAATTYEMEDGTLSGPQIVTNHEGYTGTGFVDYVNSSNDYVELAVNATSGNYNLSFRYALASGNRPLEIKVNGQVVNSSLSFPATGSWSTWGYTETIPVTLNAGANTVRATAIGYSGANVDHLLVE